MLIKRRSVATFVALSLMYLFVFSFVALLISSFHFAVSSAAQVATVAIVGAHYGYDGSVVLPDRRVTPGLIRTSSLNEVCRGGSTRQYRHTTQREKEQVYAWYGAIKASGRCCEVDHLIPLELGGSDDLGNLWPQPYEPRPGAHEKDKVENYLHEQVCRGRMKLSDAQTQIASDWFAVYQRMPHLKLNTR
jgi:hypothetical protein